MSKMIAVWGNPQAGKTTMSIKLACELAKTNKNVVVMFTDILAPDMSTIMPFEKNIESMGNLFLQTQNLSDSDILNKMQETINKNIGLMGYKHSENVFTYIPYTKMDVVKVLNKIRNIAEYIIIDCMSDVTKSVITLSALEMSDTIIRLCSADTKAMSFYDANLGVLADSRFNLDAHIKIITKSKANTPDEVFADKYGDVKMMKYEYNEKLDVQMAEAKLFEEIKDKKYTTHNQKTIESIVKKIGQEE